MAFSDGKKTDFWSAAIVPATHGHWAAHPDPPVKLLARAALDRIVQPVGAVYVHPAIAEPVHVPVLGVVCRVVNEHDIHKLPLAPAGVQGAGEPVAHAGTGSVDGSLVVSAVRF